MVIVTQGLLYLCFSLLMGTMLGYAVLVTRMPKFHVPKWLLLVATAGVGLLAFVPVLTIIINFTANMDLWTAVQLVLFEFGTGRTWLFIFLISVLLFCLIAFGNIANDRMLSGVGLLFVVLLAIGQGASSHASELQVIWGTAVHTIHLLAVSVWAGLLFIFGWFTRTLVDWQRVLKWFTPLAITCVLVLVISGYFTMDVVTSDFSGESASVFNRFGNSWLIDYGQALLFKHLLLIPLLGYGIINGFLFRQRLEKDPGHQLQPWMKTESILILIVFSITAFIGEQALPNQIPAIIEQEGASSLFHAIYGQTVHPEMMVILDVGFMSVALFLLAAVFFICMIYIAKMKMHPALSFLMAMFLVLTGYLGLMLAVV
ncbi:CopD family protein [Virgibacillus sp. NKC19-16]|uniref:copper resistance D family protein n=1 Tax=Virgibacillus salidurans TaxID=2831673 RepID=UPI001F3CA813|nr:CopD family protein [Virgibacillus sp. NKC19-16]UJL45747.1 CopD family protein [Virgibacillus sp. NKC19-16]